MAAKNLLDSRNGRLTSFGLLYVSEGIPYGFTSVAMVAFMRTAGLSLEQIGMRAERLGLGPEGIRVNGISAGPIKTLAAAGIGGFRKILNHVAEMTPLRRNITIDDVGNAAAFLCSDLAAGVTGEILYVDAGYSHVGMVLDEA